MIVLIDNYDSFTYNLYQLLSVHYPEIKVVRNDALSLEELQRLQPKGLVISPGPGTPEQAGISIEAIQVFAGSIPILGVCLGHQALAVAFGGKVSGANEIVHGKQAPIFHRRQGIFAQLPLPFVAGRYHSLIVEKEGLPPELLIEAETANGLIMAIRHRDYPLFGVQFHPESILTPAGDTLLKNFVGYIHRVIQKAAPVDTQVRCRQDQRLGCQRSQNRLLHHEVDIC